MSQQVFLQINAEVSERDTWVMRFGHESFGLIEQSVLDNTSGANFRSGL